MPHRLGTIKDGIQSAAAALRVVSTALKPKDAPLMPCDAEAFALAISPIRRSLRTAAPALQEMPDHQAVFGDLSLHEAIGQIRMVDDVLTGVQLEQTDGACLPDLAPRCRGRAGRRLAQAVSERGARGPSAGYNAGRAPRGGNRQLMGINMELSTLPPSRGNDLADPGVVSDLVRGFVSHILILRSEWHEAPDDERIDPTEEVETLAWTMGQVFLGKHPEYLASPFNVRHRLGVLMEQLVPTTGDPGQAFFEWLALQTMRASLEVEAGGDEADAHRQLEAIVADVISRLCPPKHMP